MFEVGQEYLGYSVVAVEGDRVTIITPAGIDLSFSVSGITGGLKEVLCLIGIPAACQ